MALKEQIDKFNQNVESKKAQKVINRQERFKSLQQIFDGLKLNDFFEELRDEVWGMGTIETESEPSDDDRYPGFCSIRLKAKWPKFCGEHVIDIDSEGHCTYCQPYVGQKTIYLTVELLERYKNQKINLSVKRWIGYKELTDEENRDYIETVISTTSVIDESNLSLESRDIWIKPLDINLFDKDYGDKIRERIIEYCAAQKVQGNYPLTRIAEQDRNEIIHKVLEGILDRSKIPSDFGYNFPPLQPEATAIRQSEQPPKRSFLDKLLGR
jgi:hypothetical protein